MALTDAQFQAWLDSDDCYPVCLYQIGMYDTVANAEVVMRVSNRDYGNATTPYASGIAQDLIAVEAITLDGRPRVSAGEIKVWNIGGERNAWLSNIAYNRDLFLYVGDVRWPESDFRLMYVGMIEDIASTQGAPMSDPTLTIKLRDAAERLNAPVTELTLPDGSVWPHSFGEVANITPKLKTASPVEYTYHPTAAEGIIAARVDGKRRTAITDKPASGTTEFLTAIGPGAVTMSVQGDKTGGVYRNKIGALVRLLVQSYGRAGERFTDAEIDVAGFNQFDIDFPYPVGLYLTDRTLVVDACARLASSVRAQLVPSMTGVLRLIRCKVPTTATAKIEPWQYAENGLSEVGRSKVVAAVNLGYCQNHTPQPNLVTSLKPKFKDMFATAWKSVLRVNETAVTRYRVTRAATMVETRLLREADAILEADSRLAEDSVQRTTYAIAGTRSLLLQQLGQAVMLYGNDYNLQGGKVGQIRVRQVNFENLTVNTEVTC